MIDAPLIDRTSTASAPAAAQGPHADNVKAFNGTSLQGWRPEGAAQWRVAGGELVGSATSGPGWLVLDKSYQDIILKFAFQCSGCDAGVVLRNVSSKPGATSALYAGISGPDALTLFVSVDLFTQAGEDRGLLGPRAHDVHFTP